jgi:hypothetical protein
VCCQPRYAPLHGNVNLPHLILPVPRNSLQERSLPGKEFDQLHSTKQFLQQLCPLVRPHHRLSSNVEQRLHDLTLQWGQDDEDGEACQGTWPEGAEQQTKTDQHLDWCGPKHVKESAAEIYSRDVRRDVVD